jgi:hypothetical protein
VNLVCWPLFGILYQPRMRDEYGAFGGMRIGRGNQIKPAPMPLCPPQIPHDLTWVQTQAASDQLPELWYGPKSEVTSKSVDLDML